MKTPREIILERHKSADAKLQSIRPEELAALSRASAIDLVAPETPPGLGVRQSSAAFPYNFTRHLTLALRVFPQNFWHQSILPWRRMWAGIAAVWLAIFALHAASGDSPNTAVVQAARTSPQVMAALHEQKDLLAQLLGPIPPSIADRPKIPGPRSEQRRELFIA